MSEQTTSGDTTQEQPVEMSPEVLNAREALATVERQSGNTEFADKFVQQNFDSVEAVYDAFRSQLTASKAEGEAEATPSDPEPTLLAGKFKSPEELEKAYKELESKLGQPKEAPKETQGEPSEQPSEGLTVPETKLDFETLNQYYADNGSLSEAHYEALNKAGFDKASVDNIISLAQAGAQAQQGQMQAQEAELKNLVGGADRYSEMVKWASQNLSDSERQTFDKAVGSDPGIAKMAIESLKNRWEKTVGTGSTSGMATGASSPAGGTKGFESEAEMVQAFNDPRFNTSPSYRREVEARMAKTTM